MCHSPLSTVTMSISKPCWKLIRKKIYCSMSWSSLQITYSKSVHVIVFFYSWNPNYTVAITRKVMFDTKDFLWYISLKWASIRFDKLLYRHLVHFSLLMISSIRNKLSWYWKISTFVSSNVIDVMLTVTLSIKRIAAVLKTSMTALSRGALQNSDNCCLDINYTITNWRVSLSKICHEWPNNTVTHECAHRI